MKTDVFILEAFQTPVSLLSPQGLSLTSLDWKPIIIIPKAYYDLNINSMEEAFIPDPVFNQENAVI